MLGQARHHAAGIPPGRALRRRSANCRARGRRAEVYRNDPDADFHAMVARDDRAAIATCAKAINFAKIYGAGVKKMAEMIGKPLAEAQAIITQYDAQAAVRRAALAIARRRPARVGYTELYDGARRHWNLWEVPWIYAKGAGPCDVEEARRRIAIRSTPGSAAASRANDLHRAQCADPGLGRAAHQALDARRAGAKASCRCCRCTTAWTAR